MWRLYSIFRPTTSASCSANTATAALWSTSPRPASLRQRDAGTGRLKVYEIAEKLGYESAFYFSKVFKKVTGLSRGNTSKVFKIGGFYDTGTACSSAGISSRLPALSPCQRAHRMAGAAPAGKAALFAGGGSRAANAHCAPAALALAGFHPHWAAHPMGDGLLFPPGAAVRAGKCRVCGAQRALSG